jgi:orotidine-5'-phosphate decarboxylase
MDGYASAWLGNGPLGSDALTVSPYQGLDALEPAFVRADESGAVVFVLAATSNVDAATLQQSLVGSDTLPSVVAHFARERSAGRRTVGVVVGATRPLVDSGLSPEDLADILVLAPGFGAQGASLTSVRAIFGDAAPRVIPSVSRSVLQHGLDAVDRAIDEHLRELSF